MDDHKALARTRLVEAADQLFTVLSTLNQFGDEIDTRIATQAEGCPYGEVYDGLKALLDILWPGKASEIIGQRLSNDCTMLQAVFAATYADRCRAAATFQFLDPIMAALDEADINYRLEQTGGMTMVLSVAVGSDVWGITADDEDVTTAMLCRYTARAWDHGEEESEVLHEVPIPEMVAKLRALVSAESKED